jgi:hypothetical protein
MSSSSLLRKSHIAAEYYKRFTSCVDVAESGWRTLVPTVAATNETNEKTSRDKFITCIFLGGVDTVTMLSHYMKGKGVHMTDEDKEQATLTSFMQKHKNVTCYKCGKKGHYANKCPYGEKR